MNAATHEERPEMGARRVHARVMVLDSWDDDSDSRTGERERERERERTFDGNGEWSGSA